MAHFSSSLLLTTHLVTKPNHFINSFTKCSVAFFSSATFNTAPKLINIIAQGPAVSCVQRNALLSAFGARYNAYYAQSDDVDFEGDDVGINQTTRPGGKAFGKIGISQIIQTELNCTKAETEKMIRVCKRLLKVSRFSIAEKVQHFKSFGYNEELLIANPWLLTLEIQEIPLRLSYVKSMGLAGNEGVHFLKLSTKVLHKMSKRADKESPAIPGGNRLKLLSELFESDISEVCKMVAKYPFMCDIPFLRIDAVMKQLLAHDISPKNILNDLWVFRYSPSTVEYRLQKASSAGYQNMKPWLVHCSGAAFEKSLERHSQATDTLGTNRSVEEYLSQRLDCSHDNVAAIYRNYPLLSTVHVNKMKEILDFLFAENFTAQQIEQVPRVLCHSLETLRERLAQLRNLGHNPSSLFTLCRSKRQFAEFLLKLKTRQSQTVSA